MGLATGTAETIMRTTVGAVELGTFFIPNPVPTKKASLSYQPLMKPVHPWDFAEEQ